MCTALEVKLRSNTDSNALPSGDKAGATRSLNRRRRSSMNAFNTLLQPLLPKIEVQRR